MCIICYKPAGADFPSLETLHVMWYRNPDGAGFMFPHDGNVHIEKGFMTFDDFINNLQAFDQTYDLVKLPVVIHFRIGTHGGNTAENTHPFPLTSSFRRMHHLTSYANVGIAHNGIIPITPSKPNVSDTMEFIRSCIFPISQQFDGWMNSRRILKCFESIINGSRMIFMDADGNVKYIGKWHKDGDLWYSNQNYKYVFQPKLRYYLPDEFDYDLPDIPDYKSPKNTK